MAEQMPPLCILVQPKAFYRERYIREINRQKHRAQRFIHGEDNPHRLAYPTVLIPEEWIRRMSHRYYVRLALVTVPNEHVHERCVHPYVIDTDDKDVIKDSSTNSLYFPVSDAELQNRYKSFQFSLQKLTQRELKDHGPLKILHSDKTHHADLTDPVDPKQMINLYQLSSSQVLFSLATFEADTKFPVTYTVSSVYSQVMVGMLTVSTDNEIQCRCAPRRGDYHGGDEVLIYVPQFDKRKRQDVFFEYPSTGQRFPVNLRFIDDKTILFSTPPCPLVLTRENPTVVVPIVITQNNIEIIRIDFTYQSLQSCLFCNANPGHQNTTASGGYKRPGFDFEKEEEEDDPEFPSSVLNHPKRSVSASHSHPHRSGCGTRASASTMPEDNFLLLLDTIRQGNIDAATDLIAQWPSFLDRQNQEGETPLLLAAKLNQNGLLSKILQQRPELAIQTDRAKKTIENVLKRLDRGTKERLIMQSNNDGRTPQQLAANYGNNQCAPLLFMENIT